MAASPPGFNPPGPPFEKGGVSSTGSRQATHAAIVQQDPRLRWTNCADRPAYSRCSQPSWRRLWLRARGRRGAPGSCTTRRTASRGAPCRRSPRTATAPSGSLPYGLSRFDGERWQSFTAADGLPDDDIHSLAGRGGRRALSMGGGRLGRIKRVAGAVAVSPVKGRSGEAESPSRPTARGRPGRARRGPAPIRPRGRAARGRPRARRPFRERPACDREGGLRAAVDGDLWRAGQGAWEMARAADALPSGPVTALLEDSRGVIGVRRRARRRRVRRLLLARAARFGVEVPVVAATALAEDGEGRVWVGTRAGAGFSMGQPSGPGSTRARGCPPTRSSRWAADPQRFDLGRHTAGDRPLRHEFGRSPPPVRHEEVVGRGALLLVGLDGARLIRGRAGLRRAAGASRSRPWGRARDSTRGCAFSPRTRRATSGSAPTRVSCVWTTASVREQPPCRRSQTVSDRPSGRGGARDRGAEGRRLPTATGDSRGAEVRALAVDAEAGLWVGTAGGLSLLRDGDVGAAWPRGGEGPAGRAVSALLVDRRRACSGSAPTTGSGSALQEGVAPPRAGHRARRGQG